MFTPINPIKSISGTEKSGTDQDSASCSFLDRFLLGQKALPLHMTPKTAMKDLGNLAQTNLRIYEPNEGDLACAYLIFRKSLLLTTSSQAQTTVPRRYSQVPSMSVTAGISAPSQGFRANRIFFGWYIVIAGMSIQALGYGARYSYSVFFPALIDQFGWPRDLGASILSIHLLFYGLTAPLAGGIIDRIGSRRTMYSGTVLMALGLILSRWGCQPWHFYLTFGALAGTGLCLLGSVPLTMVVRNWFERWRGTALSLVFFGIGAAYGCYPAVAWLIDAFGWRNAYTIEGFVVAAVFVPVVGLVLVYHPREKGLTRDGLASGGDQTAVMDREKRRVVDREWAAREWTLGQAVRTSRFWLLCLTTFCMWGVGHHIIVTHQIAFAIDVGYDRLYASAVLSLGGWTFCLGALLSLISDRIGREPALTIGAAACVSAIAVLLMIRDTALPWRLYYFSVAFGFGYGVCTPVVATVVTDIFQGPKVGATVGFVWFSFAMGGAVGPWFGGLLFELGGNYRLAFGIAGGLFILAAAAIWLAAPRKVRLAPGRVRG
jgi:MFS family permease